MQTRARIPVFLAILFLAPALASAIASQREIPKEWLTPAEAAAFQSTPTYQQTLEFLQKLQPRLPEMYLGFYGSSGEGRALPFVIVSKEKAFTGRRAQRLPKPIVMIQNGIHAGEIDGKDASLMILRDLALGQRRELLDAMTLVILPIYNVDGHERISKYNRPNQNGPVEGMGFRTTASGLDLNRDHLKLSSSEARALLALVNDWRPHLHVDNHVTDGVDHDWVLTWAYPEAPQIAAPVDAWLRAHMPSAFAATEKAGHRNGPYVDLRDGGDPAKGFSSWTGEPRFSSGYFPLRHRPSILVETHSYKPYRERVLATRDFLLALLAEVAKDPGGLTKAVADAEAATVAAGRPDAPPSDAVVSYRESETPETIRFPVYAWETAPSVVSGQPQIRYRSGEVKEIEVSWYHRSEVAKTVPRPRGYLVLPGWPQIEERLRGHDLRVQRLSSPVEIEVETMRVSNPEYAAGSYQGLVGVRSQVSRKMERRRIPAGALWIPADQPDFEVAVQLLEPEAPDSLLSWGLLSSVFEQKEYIDPRVLEGHVARMLQDPKIAAEWEAARKDEKLAGDPRARYSWWYRRTPYWDETVGLLPYVRVLQAPRLETRPWH